MANNPVLSHLLELREAVILAMRNPNISVAMYNESRERVAALDASLTEMGYDVVAEVKARTRPPESVAVKRHIRRRMRKREETYTAKLRKHFGVKA